MPSPRILRAAPCPVDPPGAPAELGEAPGWDAERQELFWVDITGGRLSTAVLTGTGATERRRYDTGADPPAGRVGREQSPGGSEPEHAQKGAVR